MIGLHRRPMTHKSPMLDCVISTNGLLGFTDAAAAAAAAADVISIATVPVSDNYIAFDHTPSIAASMHYRYTTPYKCS